MGKRRQSWKHSCKDIVRSRRLVCRHLHRFIRCHNSGHGKDGHAPSEEEGQDNSGAIAPYTLHNASYGMNKVTEMTKEREDGKLSRDEWTDCPEQLEKDGGREMTCAGFFGLPSPGHHS